jgi:eukaryotic-like serine/threonine-protein kinase
VALAVTFLLGERTGSRSPPNYRQLTFRQGFVGSARFAPDRQTILYTAAWEGRPPEVFLARAGSAESRPFGLAGAEVLAMSTSGEMAVSVRRRNVELFIRTGTLARISVTGAGAHREIQEDVQWADWSPDAENLAIVRDSGVRNRLEFPIGKILYETTGWISNPRVSPNGDLVAFMDHPTRPDDGGAVAIVDRSGHKRTLSPLFTTAQGLAWSPGGREIWFTAAAIGGNRALYAVTLLGRQRLIARVPGMLTLEDISRDGQVLVTHALSRIGILGLIRGEQKERDLSWLDYSGVTDLSADGTTMAFFESGEGAGPSYSVYIRKTDGSPAVRLGEGAIPSLSPDGKWVLALAHITSDPQIVLYPTAAGQPRVLSRDGLSVRGAAWLPDGRRIVLSGSEPGRGVRLYVRDLAGGMSRAITPEGYRFFTGLGGVGVVSPDGKLATAVGPDQRSYLCPLEGECPHQSQAWPPRTCHSGGAQTAAPFTSAEPMRRPPTSIGSTSRAVKRSFGGKSCQTMRPASSASFLSSRLRTARRTFTPIRGRCRASTRSRG